MQMLDDDINLAAKVHYSFIPDGFENDKLDIAITSRPLRKLGGDYCSVMPVGDDRFVICICDATGHGVAAALYSARVNTFVLTHAIKSTCPCDLVQSLNDYLCRRLIGTGIYTTFATAYIDTKDMHLVFAGAAHPPLLHYEASSTKITQINSRATLLGLNCPLKCEIEPTRTALSPGDRVLLYTDGLSEARDKDGTLFGAKALAASLKNNHELTGDELNNIIVEEAASHCSDLFTDDLLLMSISIK